MNNIKSLLACASIGIGLSAATSAHSQQHNITVAANVTQMHWLSTQSYEPLQKCITDGTKGEIAFQYFPASQMGNAYQMVEVLNSGLANMSLISPSFVSDSLPINGIPLLPDLGNSAVEIVKSYRAALDGDTLIAKELRDRGVHPIAIHIFPPYQILMRGAPAAQVSEIEGKKIRAGGGTLDFTVSALGGVVVGMDAADVYLALQQGVVDGTLLSVTSIKPYKLNEVIKSMSANASLGVASSLWAFDLDTWNAFSPEQQKIITECGLKIEADVGTWSDEENARVLDEMRESGLTVYDFSEDALSKIGERLQLARDEYIGRLERRGLPAQAAYDEYIVNVGRN